ncbi:hypothetical protein LguiB_034081 [Lonicera macranthoides]
MASACFDCNICLEFAHEPVVTLCGHLYCWPCIYKWFRIQSSSLSSYEHPQCPVCKSSISDTTLVPLYSRGEPEREPKHDSKAPFVDMTIPPRPPACGTATLLTEPPTEGQRIPYQDSGSYEEDSSPPVFGRRVSGGTDTDGFQFQPVAGMLGEMVYARVFGNSDRLYAYSNTYGLAGSSSPRLRWQEMQADKSLNRISVFLLCCFLLCLIVF